MLGNLLPHLHTHIVPRYYGDPAPGRPLDPSHAVHLLRAADVRSGPSSYAPLCRTCRGTTPEAAISRSAQYVLTARPAGRTHHAPRGVRDSRQRPGWGTRFLDDLVNDWENEPTAGRWRAGDLPHLRGAPPAGRCGRRFSSETRTLAQPKYAPPPSLSAHRWVAPGRGRA